MVDDKAKCPLKFVYLSKVYFSSLYLCVFYQNLTQIFIVTKYY